MMDRSEILSILMQERTKQVALAWSILRQSQLAEDAYQDMLVKVFENESVFEGPRHLRDWSWKVLRRRCYEFIRRKNYRPSLLVESILDLVDAELECRDAEEINQRVDALHQCLANLTVHCRDVVRLRFSEGLSGIEVAEKLGRTPDTVYKTLHRIYSTLGECVQDRLGAWNAETSHYERRRISKTDNTLPRRCTQ
ncbi:RNA polymerase sigma-70 factor, ECF subfamily [Neorhodopirellula lusitana]|uniref:RNA polymerase sigma-70 factor, ECF subfamily n=1 Tax=Neorhodopirellula lusitana TaxID=445327 RepID=A0ABY1QSE9_9BACT|nr:sigma-70 family RNA polymerase sigma factor [Neorhodopirellula lusitana]SMP78879.1 RNA polymerase sigma-70 factor, ECF subfamily [Neorhodopirellula lusitana]